MRREKCLFNIQGKSLQCKAGTFTRGKKKKRETLHVYQSCQIWSQSSKSGAPTHLLGPPPKPVNHIIHKNIHTFFKTCLWKTKCWNETLPSWKDQKLWGLAGLHVILQPTSRGDALLQDVTCTFFLCGEIKKRLKRERLFLAARSHNRNEHFTVLTRNG